MQPGWESVQDEGMCEVKTPFSHSEYMNPGILRCQKDIAIYLHCEILPLLSISLFILSNVIVLFRQGNKSQEKEAVREKGGGKGEEGIVEEDEK